MAAFLDGLVSHYVLDDGKIVVAHAGMKEVMQGRGSGKVREFALYGETTGETDEFGLPVRYNWAAEYRGDGDGRLRPHARAAAGVAQQHDQHRHRLRLRRRADGAALPGAGVRFGSRRSRPTANRRGRSCPLKSRLRALSAQHVHDDLLDLPTCSASGSSPRGCDHNVTIREENATAALEVMSRFAANPKWLVYLPPTMSPSRDDAVSEGYLEHPAEAFAYFRNQGVPHVVCEEKHMGSRAVVVVCRDEEAAAQAIWRRRASRDRHHPHRPAVLQRRRARKRHCSTACARR